MGHQTEIGKTTCFFCGKSISRNGLGFVSHMRKHVREGIACEVKPGPFNGLDHIGFINLRRPAKIGTIPKNIILDKCNFDPKIGQKIKFREDIDGSKWINGFVDDINEQCIFITKH